LLALAPEQVRTELAVAGNATPLGELMAAIRQGTVRAVSDNGVLGDPRGASAEEGWALLDRLSEKLCEAVARWRD
jgi:creatinine amidohydrolase